MMKRKPNAKSCVFAFLKSSGVLENGTHEEIQSKRKEYWNEYKRKWRKMKRTSEKEFSVSFSKEDLKDITEEAKRHKLSRTKFIKQACIAYMNKRYIVPDMQEVKKISQLLSMTHNVIQDAILDSEIEHKNGKFILESVNDLERNILPKLINPISLEELIKNQIINKPKMKSSLIEFINSI